MCQRSPGAGSLLVVIVVFQPVKKYSLQPSNYRELSSITVCLCLKAPLHSRASLGEYGCWPVVSTLLGEHGLGFQLAWNLTESWQSYTPTPEDVDNTQSALSTASEGASLHSNRGSHSDPSLNSAYAELRACCDV